MLNRKTKTIDILESFEIKKLSKQDKDFVINSEMEKHGNLNMVFKSKKCLMIAILATYRTEKQEKRKVATSVRHESHLCIELANKEKDIYDISIRLRRIPRILTVVAVLPEHVQFKIAERCEYLTKNKTFYIEEASNYVVRTMSEVVAYTIEEMMTDDEAEECNDKLVKLMVELESNSELNDKINNKTEEIKDRKISRKKRSILTINKNLFIALPKVMSEKLDGVDIDDVTPDHREMKLMLALRLVLPEKEYRMLFNWVSEPEEAYPPRWLSKRAVEQMSTALFIADAVKEFGYKKSF